MECNVFFLKEKKMQSKCMFRVVDDVVKGPHKIIPGISDFV